MKACWSCGCEWTEKFAPGHRDLCDRCGTPWHTCRNCRFFVSASRDWCNEPAARDEVPSDAETANRCSFFMLRDAASAPEPPVTKRRTELEGLFSPPPASGQTPLPDWARRRTKGGK